MATPSENIASKLNLAKTQAEEQVDFMIQRILVLDSEKEDLDESINKIDLSIQQQIDNVNTQIQNVVATYQARIDSGCRTLKNWVQTGIATVGVTEYPVYTCVAIDPDLQQIKPLHKIKYYDEPATKDILDSTIGSFIGTCGIGSTHITVMSIAGSGTTQGMQVGQTITCDQSGVFASPTTIIGFTTSVANLFPVGIGTSGDIEVVDVIITSNSTGAAVAAASAVEFDVLGFATSFNIPPVKMTDSPFVPQTIGIMYTSIVGTGTYIEYTNSSSSPTTQSWNPFLNGLKIKKAIISEPVVGAGITLYNIGSTQMPTIFGAEANPGVSTTFLSLGIGTMYTPLPSCNATVETNNTNALNTLTTLETGLTVGSNNITQRIQVSNALRVLRNKYNSQIWGMRQVLSELYKEENQFNEASAYINSTAVKAIIDT